MQCFEDTTDSLHSYQSKWSSY